MKSLFMLLLFSITAISQNKDVKYQKTSTKSDTMLNVNSVQYCSNTVNTIENATEVSMNTNNSLPELKLIGETKIESVKKDKEFAAKPELRLISIDTASTNSED